MEKQYIILADDHAVVRAGIRKVLEEIPSLEVVAEVGDGPALFETLDQVTADCVLIDITMPGFEPISAVYQIRAQYPDLRLLIVSAYDDDFYVKGLLKAGVNGYHLKDQPLSDLQLAIQRVMAGEIWLSKPLINKLVGTSQPASAPSILTTRQRDILRLLQEGLDNHGIAQEMGLSVKTVENHLTRLYKQLQVQSRLEAVNYLNQHPELLGVIGQEIVQRSPVKGAQPKGVTILLVDDNSRYLNQLQHVIGKAYPQAILYEADSIVTAVHLAQRISPQLVLVDVVLGEEDGIRCARRIKAVSQQSRIIMISAYPDREFHRLSLEAGAVAFLDKKDLDAVTLREVIGDVIA
ncbi:MAG: response regulator transcription factor [Chloroflexi bacterium]|nr:response regulator transcription factor [Chloroflexota bacterium]